MSTTTFVAMITECGGALAHRVPQEQISALPHGRSVRALCGREFVPAALSAPHGRSCPRCAGVHERIRRSLAGRRRSGRPAAGAGG